MDPSGVNISCTDLAGQVVALYTLHTNHSFARLSSPLPSHVYLIQDAAHTSQGVWITLLAEQCGSHGYLTGLFFFIFNANLLLSSSTNIASNAAGQSLDTLLYIVTALSGLGTIMIMLAPSPYPNGNKGAQTHHTTVAQQLRRVQSAAHKHELWLLAPYIIQQGISQTFSVSSIPGKLRALQKLALSVY